jgi:hypothetical protein
MASQEKSDLYRQRKDSGVPLTRPYVEYTIDQLRAELTSIALQSGTTPDKEPEPAPEPEFMPEPEPMPEPIPRPRDPEEMPSQRLNTQDEDEIIRVDEQGRQWIQEEVLKPAYPKPRGRRVLTYIDTGVEQKSVQSGEYVETFEVAGKGTGRPAEVKITLPSYQVGIYKDPRFPFKVITYNGRNGFDLFDVQKYYGGAELVPVECKRTYIENVLCYDIRTVIRAIQTEHRHLQLTGRIK